MKRSNFFKGVPVDASRKSSMGSVDGLETSNLRTMLSILRDTKSIRTPLPGYNVYPKLQYCKGETLTERYQIGIDCDEVYPNIILGDEGTALDINYLKVLGVTHVLNCAEGKCFGQVQTTAAYYRTTKIVYKGIEIIDMPHYQISEHFNECIDFIDNALQNKVTGKILVHCLMGMSRSATMVIAYLISKCGMTGTQALRHIVERRDIRPNDGFLRQLCEFEAKIRPRHASSTSNPGGFRLPGSPVR